MTSPTTTNISSLTSVTSLLTLKPLYPSLTRPIAPDALFLPVTTTALIATTLLSRSTRIKIAVPALLLLAGQTRATSTGDPAKDFGRACIVFGLGLRFVDFGLVEEEGGIWRVDAEDDGKEKEGHRGEGEDGEEKGKEKERSVWRRLWDGADLFVFNMRGIGWNWKVGGIPEREPQSQSYFLFRTALRIIGSFLGLDLTKYISSQIPYILTTPRPSFFALPFPTQVLLTWLHQLEAFVVINLPYQILAFVFVALRIQSQASWPPLFGNLSDAYLVSRAWGRTWHQLLRRSLGLLTPHAQKFLGAKSRSAKRIVSLAGSFFLSGMAHWVGAFNLPWTPTSGGMFWYFMMQAPVIRMEDYVIEWGERRELKGRVLRILGYVWTFAWISWSMRYAAAFQFESGPLSRFVPMKYSLIGKAIEGFGW